MKRLLAAAGILVALGLAFFFTISFEMTGRFEGIFILKGSRKLLEIDNDLHLGDEGRLLVGIPVEPLLRRFRKADPPPPFLEYEWDDDAGEGFIIQHLPGNRELLTCFGRFVDDSGKVPPGLFLGGGLPFTPDTGGKVTMNSTGMAYYNGVRWNHLWCNVNELITPLSSEQTKLYPSRWTFLGSKLLKQSPQHLLIWSGHRITIGRNPVRIDKFASFQVGQPYFILITRMTNEGAETAGFNYLYGDEPWVGDFGTSRGNVGWMKGQLVFYEGEVDALATSYIGFYDVGNPANDEGHNFTGTANFIEWLGPFRPDLVYFTNRVGPLHRAQEKIPLYVDSSRSLYLQWGPRYLLPGYSETYAMAIGMARGTAYPVLPEKPETVIPADMLPLLK